MNTKTGRILSATGVVACLLIAASLAWAHREHDYGYRQRGVIRRREKV